MIKSGLLWVVLSCLVAGVSHQTSSVLIIKTTSDIGTRYGPVLLSSFTSWLKITFSNRRMWKMSTFARSQCRQLLCNWLFSFCSRDICSVLVLVLLGCILHCDLWCYVRSASSCWVVRRCQLFHIISSSHDRVLPLIYFSCCDVSPIGLLQQYTFSLFVILTSLLKFFLLSICMAYYFYVLFDCVWC